MAALDDIKQAVTALGTAVSDLGTATTTELQAITDKLASMPTNSAGFIDPADLAPVTAQITALTGTVGSVTKQISDEAAALKV